LAKYKKYFTSVPSKSHEKSGILGETCAYHYRDTYNLMMFL